MKKTTKTTQPKPEYLWLIMGEGATPETFGDDFSALADALYEGRVEAPAFDWLVTAKGMPGGFQSGMYEGPVNHVGLYWGDENEEFVRNLTKVERLQVENKVRELMKLPVKLPRDWREKRADFLPA